MIPSRGLRWSGQVIGIGRRREILSARQFSIRSTPNRSSPLPSKSGTSILRTNTRTQFSKTSSLIQNGAGIRFASTNPLATTTSSTTPDPASAVSSSALSVPEVATSSLDNALDFASDSLHSIPEHIGYLKSLGLDYGWGPTSGIEWLLEHVHIFAGTPWWASITITALVIRAALIKPFIDAAVNGAKTQALRHVLDPLTAQMKAAMTAGDQARGMQCRQEMSEIKSKAGISLWKGLIPMAQMFTGYGTFVLLRAMAALPVPGFENGGILWFNNLAIADPFYILPVATSLILHWSLRRGGETGAATISPEAMKLMMYGFPALSLVFTWWLPAALQLSFLVSGLCSFAQASLFARPAFREYVGMPPLSETTRPKPGPDGKPPAKPSPYKGTMRVRAPLSTADINSAFQQSRKESMLEKARRQVLDSTKEVRGAAGTVMEKTFTSTLDERKAKAQKRERDDYEARRVREIKDEKMWRVREAQEAQDAKRMKKQAR